MMAIRSTTETTGKLYNAQSELEWASKHLLSCFFILGLTEADMETSTIDDLIDRCGWMFEPHPESVMQYVNHVFLEEGGKVRWHNSGIAFGRKQKSLMMLLIRRFWRRRHISLYEVENNV